MWYYRLIGFIMIMLPIAKCCPFVCFYDSTHRIVDCVLKSDDVPVNNEILKCSIENYLGLQLIKIGSHESLNRFEPKSLRHKMNDGIPISNVYLNVSIKLIDSNSFRGYFSNLRKLFAFSVQNITVDAFSAMPKLNEIQIESLNPKMNDQYLVVDSTNLERNIHMRLNAVCYACPKAESNKDVVYLKIISDNDDKSVVYYNINLAKCKENYAKDICTYSPTMNANVNRDKTLRNLFWLMTFLSITTFVTLIVLALILFCIKRHYKLDTKSLKTQYVSNVLYSERNPMLTN